MNNATKTPPNIQLTPVILAGGLGTRLRPLTSPSRPKALLKFFSKHSLLQKTLLRIPNLGDPIIITNAQTIPKIRKQLSAIGITNARFIAEPESKSTAPAITLAAHMAHNENLLILPCDQYIGREDEFEEQITTAAVIDLSDKYLLFGARPTYPATHYGYIEAHFGSLIIDKVSRFTEKPDEATAKQWIKSIKYFWNTGIFLTSARHILREMELFNPEMLQQIEHSIYKIEDGILHLHPDKFHEIQSISIDYALMEKTETAYVSDLDLPWSDIGTWPSLLRAKFGMI